MEGAVWPLGSWEGFYVIIGTSAAALTGLQFVVIVLGSDLRALGGTPAIRAFGTPTVVHFCAVLYVSAIITAPWQATTGAAVGLGAGGLVGVIYGARVVRHARSQTEYEPVLEDWIFHGVLPPVAYAAMFVGAVFLRSRAEPALFVIAASVVALLFVGIHNAWDAVVYIASSKGQQERSTPTSPHDAPGSDASALPPPSSRLGL